MSVTERPPQDGNLPAPEKPRFKLALLLLLATLVTTLLAGSLWHPSFMMGIGQSAPDTAGFLVWPDFLLGIPYAISVRAIRLAHERGETPSPLDDLLQDSADVEVHAETQDGGAQLETRSRSASISRPISPGLCIRPSLSGPHNETRFNGPMHRLDPRAEIGAHGALRGPRTDISGNNS